jgi:hypothetical protein
VVAFLCASRAFPFSLFKLIFVCCEFVIVFLLDLLSGGDETLRGIQAYSSSNFRLFLLPSWFNIRICELLNKRLLLINLMHNLSVDRMNI